VHGDVLPTIAIGWELKRRGHDVIFVGNPHYARRVIDAGLSFSPVGTIADHERLIGDADVFDRAKKSAHDVFAEHYFPHLDNYYETVNEMCQRTPSVVVGGELGSFTAAEKLGIPFAFVACSPVTSSIESTHDPHHPERTLPAWARWFAANGKRLALLYRLRRLSRNIVERRVKPVPPPTEDHPLLRLRARVGLHGTPQIRPQKILCMWPDWFAAPQPDWPKEAVIAGFPLWPRPTYGAPGELAAWHGIVVTTGSAASGQHEFYATVVEACTASQRPAILVTPHRDQLPRNLPPSVTHLEYAPFHELFGRASLILHHGGIGTGSYALAAGVPQIVMPLRGDQFDNGNRLARLGVAKMIPPRDARPARLAKLIRTLLDSAIVAHQCRYWRSRIDLDEGLRRAADCVEELGRNFH
jgi:UDP:flavonoid glycosyltransferase YjiC (YdhE family)